MSQPDFDGHRDRVKMVKSMISTCNRCELGKGSNRVPFGGTTWQPKLILLGEAPGKREDLLREPFVGPAGLLLDEMLGMVGLKRDHVMIANTVCCRPPNNRDPEWSEIQACKVNREAQFFLGRSWVGVSLGRIALGSLLEDYGITIGAHKGRPFWKDNMVWVPTYHPAYALRNRNAVGEIVAHLRLALNIYEGKDEAPKPATSKYVMEGRNLIVDHERVKVPMRVRELAEATYTKEEWARMGYQSELVKDVVGNLKRELDVTVVK